MADDFIVNNPGVSSVFLTNLGIEIPPAEDVDLLKTHDIEILQADSELAWHLGGGTLIRKVGTSTITPGDPLTDAGPVEIAQQAWTPWYSISITTPGQTTLTLPGVPVDADTIYLVVNSIDAVLGLDFTHTPPSTLTWLDREYTLDPSDEVYTKYLEEV